MAEKTAPIAQDPSGAGAPAASSPVTAPAPTSSPRRTVTMPVLPLAIIGAVVVALIFFGGGVAVGFAVGDHPTRAGVIQPFGNGRNGVQGGQNGDGQNRNGNGFGQNRNGNGNGNGFGQNGGRNGGTQNGGTQPNGGPTTAPTNP